MLGITGEVSRTRHDTAAILNSDLLSQQKRWLSAGLGFDALVPRYSTSAGRIETKFLRSHLELLTHNVVIA
jgi:hypothetical protein